MLERKFNVGIVICIYGFIFGLKLVHGYILGCQHSMEFHCTLFSIFTILLRYYTLAYFDFMHLFLSMKYKG